MEQIVILLGLSLALSLGVILGMSFALLLGAGVFIVLKLQKPSTETKEQSTLPDPKSMPVLPPEAFFEYLKHEQEQKERFEALRRPYRTKPRSFDPSKIPPYPKASSVIPLDGEEAFTEVSFLPVNRNRRTPSSQKEFSNNVIEVQFGNRK